jgi:epoxide hydrolase-like predicted phosphatase
LRRKAAKLTKSSFQDVTKAWYAFKGEWETGRIGSRQFYGKFLKKLDAEIEAERFVETIEKTFRKNVARIPESFKIIKRLKKNGYRLALLSNTNPPHAKVHFERGDYSLFNPKILSYREKCYKPGKKIYRLAAKRMGLKPRECLFVDDKKENVVGARRAGLKAVHFENPKKLAADLRKFGLELA